jgi:hypothetical protein
MALAFPGLAPIASAARSDAEASQRAFTTLRLRFNSVLTHFDLFENVVTQRSENEGSGRFKTAHYQNETGVWLSGLDVVSADALHLRGYYYQAPPVVCYLDRGMGGAIRRSRTRLPGEGQNLMAIIKVPRERIVGSGIASSPVHEVGHQAAAFFPGGIAAPCAPFASATTSLGSLGVAIVGAVDFGDCGGPNGLSGELDSLRPWKLMSVVSLPRAFVFRVNADDPHPSPWIRVKLSVALGRPFYP